MVTPQQRLARGETFENRESGNSMVPRIRHRQPVTLAPANPAAIDVGDMVYVRVHGRIYTHLVSAVRGDEVQIANNHGHVNGWTKRENVYGIVVAVDGVPVPGADTKIRRLT